MDELREIITDFIRFFNFNYELRLITNITIGAGSLRFLIL